MASASILCTLYEGRYAIGLGALVNSIYHYGFRGDVYAGYKGEGPPEWASPATDKDRWATFTPTEGLRLNFRRLKTEYHLTNYKPQFMQEVLDEFDPGHTRNVFYFDPDIVIRCPWTFFETWAGCGVALCEDINSPMPASHPIRQAWREAVGGHGMGFTRESDLYVNGGFIGLAPKDLEFLDDWRKIQTVIEPLCGSYVKEGPHGKGELGTLERRERPYPFVIMDQDALNIAMTVSRCPPSVIGKDGMSIVPGGYVMAHAIGLPKAWEARFFLKALRTGQRPSLANQLFFDYLEGPCRPVTAGWVRKKRVDLMFARLIARLIS